jgi:hypothetical protein
MAEAMAVADAPSAIVPFHIAFPVRDVQEAREFYGGCDAPVSLRARLHHVTNVPVVP